MASCGDDTIETAALGRPFQLGMLYDCRKDALIPGITLWDQEQLQKNTSVQQQIKTEFDVITSDTMEEKSNSLKMSGSMKLSLLGGLVDVGGSAKYFQDTKKSHKQARVILQYKTTTQFETLTMSYLAHGQVSHPNVFEDDTATHVVTAILYGASAYFVFDRESSSEDKKEQVEGEVNITFNKLKNLTVDADASFNMDEREKSAVDKFSCTFHRDFKLPTNPTSFSDAVRVYRDLPNMLGENGEHAVPLRVWLYPLWKLDSRAARLVRDISNDLIRYSSDTIESFTKTEMRCRDILKDTAAAAFPTLAKNVENYMQMCHQYKLDFMHKLGSVLPSIRGGGKEGSALLDILKAHESSPFNSKDLDHWLTNKEKVSETLKSFLKQLNKLDVQMYVDLDDLLNDVNVKNVVSFSFTSLDEPDHFLLKLSNDLKPLGMLKTSDVESSDLQGRNNDWLSSNIRQKMRGQLKLFEELKRMSTSDDTKFIVVSKYDESHPGACIFIYEDGNDDAILFVPPSKPATPTTTGVSYDSVTVQVSDPDSATVEYRVEYREKQNQETEWKSVQRNQEAVTLSGLKPETEYEIRTTAVGKLGYAVGSDICRAVTLSVVRPPNQLKVSEVKTNCISLTWSIPSDQTCESLKEYVIEYRTKQETKWKSHPVQKNQKAVTLSGLKPETEYEIRATAVSKFRYTVSSEVCRAVTQTVCPPNQLKVSKVKTNCISLTWSIPSDQTCDFVKEYVIEYRTKQETEWKSHPVQKNQKAVTLSGLKPETEYEIRATAVGKLGYITVSSDVCRAVTLTAVPSKPATPKTPDVSHDRIIVQVIVQVSDPDSATVEYRVEYREKQNQETEWKSHPVQRNQEAVTLSGLKPETEYEIRTTAVGKLGYAVSSDICRAVTLIAVGPPTEVKVTEVKATSITLTWSSPSVQHCESVKRYIIEFREESRNQWQTKHTRKEMYFYTLKNLKGNTTYSIRMCTDAGVGVSEPGEELQIKTKKGPLDKTKFAPLPGNPSVYLYKPTGGGNLNKKVFGSAPVKNLSNKTIMVVGATGSGKTTLINGMINYILGVEWEDNHRFKLINEETSKTQACSQTSNVTAYQIHHTDEFQVPYSLTIIDTPGFGDTRGIKQDKEITEKIRNFFSVKGGIDSIDAVCFVVQSALARLTHTQKYIFDAILSIFGKDIASNIIALVTFADGKSPPVLEAIKAADIPCATNPDGSLLHFKFNNSVLFAKNTEASSDEDNFDYMFWKMGKVSMNKFFTHLASMQPQSLTLTKEVLQERRELEATVEGLQPMIRKGLSKLEEINTTKAALQNHETHMKANEDFEFEVEVEHSEKIDIPSGKFITNCHGCNYTCHYPCYIPKDEDKSRCSAMKNGSCIVCPGKCHWTKHFNMTYRWDTTRVTEKRTYQELKSKYETALGEKMSMEKIVKQLEVEYEQVQGKVVKIMDTVTKCLRRLSEIALRPDPLSTPDYIDLLILSEEREAKPGFKERIKELQEVRQGAVLLQKVAERVDLTAKEKSKWQKIKSNVKGLFTDFLSHFE
ncbi:uncharacterized protein LOC121709700 isoform X1 [Alosa sapidissima]|uniref:uncharacterized protein LOC121709700 isoform X1 n=1 Tax=Alosa sapidissima TaxID=34773 RepID=UPI001C08209C|nr:uncharacterized protein LOC121709700 isoform X1 [Alosa sapidissima]XP_041949231.1 uncharacterized protein LOC121709700 isoform X1 [Alosa sapidissima]XP_041949239.1 uncharacterized protein LOC121709700 isoform X1 [Alosa sapidissima]